MNIIYDSPLYTREGITHASREMVKQLQRKGHNLMVTDYRYQRKFGEEFTSMYNAIDTREDDYVFFKNTRAEHWAWLSTTVKNFVGYTVLEGSKIPEEWVVNMNYDTVKMVLTPSHYCKNVFQNCGVKTPIHVIPHGFHPEVFKPLDNFLPLLPDLQDKFVFFGSGAIHGLKKEDRKGIDTLVKAYNDLFAGRDDVCLVLKINTMYAKNYHQHMGKEFKLQEYLESIGVNPSMNIMWIDQDLTEPQMVRLYNQVHCCVSPSRGEGFGLMPFEALACGTPIIVTNGGGFLEYANEENALLVNAVEDFPAEMRAPYFDNKAYEAAKQRSGMPVKANDYLAKWFTVDEEDLKAKMLLVFDNYEKYKKMALLNRDKMVEKFSWDAVGDQLNELLENEFGKQIQDRR